MTSDEIRSTARVAGLLYLAIICLGVWSEGAVRSGLLVPGDPAATAEAVRGAGLFRLSLVGDVAMALCDVALAVLLFRLFQPVSLVLAAMAAAFRLVQSAILGANLMALQEVLLLLDGRGSAVSAGAEGLAMLALIRHGYGYDLGLFFFGVSSLLWGWLLARAKFAPRLLGALVSAAGAVYLLGSLLRFLSPATAEAFVMAYALPLVVELAFAIWLLVFAGRQRRAIPT